MSERFAASSPSSVGPLFAGSRSPDACVPFLPVPVPGVFVLATSAAAPAPPASEPPPLPATHYMTRNVRQIQNCIKWNFKSPGMWQCCRTTDAHCVEGTTVLSHEELLSQRHSATSHRRPEPSAIHCALCGTKMNLLTVVILYHFGEYW